jgi:hypothetical protein
MGSKERRMADLTIGTDVTAARSPPSALSSASSYNIGGAGMSAERELELLKAQIADIARVCKVS